MLERFDCRSATTLLGGAKGISRYAMLVLFVSGLMSNDSGTIESTIVASLSFASFATKRSTGLISVIDTRTSSIVGIVL